MCQTVGPSEAPSLFAVSVFLLYSSLSVSRLFLGELLNLGVRGPSRLFLWMSLWGLTSSKSPHIHKVNTGAPVITSTFHLRKGGRKNKRGTCFPAMSAFFKVPRRPSQRLLLKSLYLYPSLKKAVKCSSLPGKSAAPQYNSCLSY